MTTSEPRSRLIKTLKERGFIYQATDLEALDALAEKESISGYIGFDATADSLHVGSLVQIMLLRWLQKTGHRPIALMGGGTTKVGDPSGKDESRRLLTIEGINKNIESIKRCFESYLTFSNGKNDAVMVNNADWLDELKYIEFLRDYGRHFSVNRMLKFDSVKLRLDRDQPLTFLEFNYMVLQAYDFVELARRYDCRLQMGGSDQYGNILNGIELGRRVAAKELFGLTAPLVTTSSGAKMGKTAAGAVWLNSDRLSPYDFWQFWRNTDDADVGRFLRLFTDLPIERIRELEGKRGADINEAKIVLANEATALCHGKPAASSAQATATRTFIEGGLGQDLPVVELPIAELSSGIPAYELLHRANLVTSNSEGRRKIKGRGARLNNEKIEDENYRVSDADLDAAGRARLSIGNTHTVIVGLMSPGASEDEFLKYLRPELPINSWVMIVDDDEKFRNDLIKKLEGQGIGAVGVKTATAALDLLRTKSPQPRLLFTDAFLFGPMSGKKLAREARQRWPRLNVLVRWNNRSMSEREKLQLRERITVLPESCSADETAQKITSILRSTNA